jgi:hypothetical protein
VIEVPAVGRIVSHPVLSVPRSWLVSGYGSAHDRFNTASQDPQSPELLFLPLFEALGWAGLLEEDARPHHDDLLWAIRFVRNRVVHQWADAVEGRNVPNPPGLVIRAAGRTRMLGPPVVWDWFWRDRGSLPHGTNNHGGPAYDTLLAGQPVRLALDQLRTKF